MLVIPVAMLAYGRYGQRYVHANWAREMVRYLTDIDKVYMVAYGSRDKVHRYKPKKMGWGKIDGVEEFRTLYKLGKKKNDFELVVNLDPGEETRIIKETRNWYTGFVPKILTVEMGVEDGYGRGKERKSRLLNMSLTEKTYYNSTRNVKYLKEMAKKYLSFSERDRMFNENEVLEFGTNMEYLDNIEESDRADDDKVTFVYGGRAAKKKNIDMQVDIVDHLYRIGYDVEMILSITNTASRVEEAKELAEGREHVKFIEGGLDRDDWLALAKESDIALCTSDYETSPYGWQEAIASGCYVPFLDKEWIDECGFVPDDYKHRMKDKEELIAVCKKIIDNMGEGRVEEQREKLESHIRENYDGQKNMERVLEEIKELK